MAYDPQRAHRRPRPTTHDPVPVDALLETDGEPARPSAHDATQASGELGVPDPPLVADDPPPAPGVTPPAADPWSDRVLAQWAVFWAAVGALTLYLARRWWEARRRARERSAD